VEVWVADVERDRSSEWSLSPRIGASLGVRVIAERPPPQPEACGRLIVQGSPVLLGDRSLLDLLAAVAEAITVVSAGDRSRDYRQAIALQWRERKWYGRWFSKVRRVVYKDGYPADVHGLYRARNVIGFDAHSKFLHDVALYRLIHAQDWESDVLRPVRVNFLGSRDPVARGRILDSVEPFFREGSRALRAGSASKAMVWHAYSDEAPAPLSPQEFLQVLSESDFTLAPPGYSRVTHRPVEALLRGSIPVLNADELDLYDLGLADGINCIAVPAGGWSAAMSRVMRMGEAEIRGMRRHVADMVTDRVAYPALARDMSRRLGIG
jgi:hypothetical protein